MSRYLQSVLFRPHLHDVEASYGHQGGGDRYSGCQQTLSRRRHAALRGQVHWRLKCCLMIPISQLVACGKIPLLLRTFITCWLLNLLLGKKTRFLLISSLSVNSNKKRIEMPYSFFSFCTAKFSFCTLSLKYCLLCLIVSERIPFKKNDVSVTSALSINGRLFVASRDHVDKLCPLPDQEGPQCGTSHQLELMSSKEIAYQLTILEYELFSCIHEVSSLKSFRCFGSCRCQVLIMIFYFIGMITPLEVNISYH